MNESRLEDVWRREAPHVLGALVRRYADFEACEDAAQDAVLAATVQWPQTGVPSNPRGWLIRVASRRLVDTVRSERSRSDRERLAAVRNPADAQQVAAADAEPGTADDTVWLLLLCCHPALTQASRVALTLRAVGGLTTAQIAAAFLVPESTMAQRISRAKSTLRTAGARFEPPDEADLPGRLAAGLQVLYLIFNEGYTTSGGDRLVDVSLTREAVRLTRDLCARLPADSEAVGLLALMLLTDARTPARTDDHGDLVPLAEQNRSLWDDAMIREAGGMLENVLPRGDVGPFQLQAAIAAVHAEAASWADTDWRQITVLYGLLQRIAPGSTVTLNLGVAIGMSQGPEAGLAVVDPLLEDSSMQRHHRVHAVRAHLLELAGRTAEAVESYTAAARLTSSTPEQRYLNRRVERLRG